MFRAQSPPAVLDENALVTELFQANRMEWNVNLVKHIFWDEDAQAILSIPISTRNTPDKLIWGLSADGSLSVKSAYTAALSIKGRNVGEVSTSLELSQI